jgi:hypothetical protein
MTNDPRSILDLAAAWPEMPRVVAAADGFHGADSLARFATRRRLAPTVIGGRST